MYYLWAKKEDVSKFGICHSSPSKIEGAGGSMKT